jgi:hypothetical protein
MRFQLYCALLIAAVATAEGQTAAVDSSFAFPSGPIVCRPVVPPATDPAAYVFEFLTGDNPEAQQWAIAEFDSAGKPLLLVTWLPSPTSTPPILKLLVVNFLPPMKGELTLITGRPDTTAGVPGSPHGDGTPSPGMPLTSSQIEMARLLATRFWEHRCKDNP